MSTVCWVCMSDIGPIGMPAYGSLGKNEKMIHRRKQTLDNLMFFVCASTW